MSWSIRSLSAKSHTPFRTIVNEALRIGLEQVEKPATQRTYRTEPHAMGLMPRRDLDNIQKPLT